MGDAGSFTPVKLIIGVLCSDGVLYDALLSELVDAFGPIELRTDPVPFDFTGYYDREMGGRPFRFFLVFRNLIDPVALAGCKIFTNRIEQERAVDGNRPVNLDPGFLSAGNLILATTKNRSHRIPLAKGIYAEVTLIYSQRMFRALPWTYADYRSPRFIELFGRIRASYLVQVKETPKN